MATAERPNAIQRENRHNLGLVLAYAFDSRPCPNLAALSELVGLRAERLSRAKKYSLAAIEPDLRPSTYWAFTGWDPVVGWDHILDRANPLRPAFTPPPIFETRWEKGFRRVRALNEMIRAKNALEAVEMTRRRPPA